jgi:hypothetical protein
MELKKMYLDLVEEYLRQQKHEASKLKAADKALEEFKYTDGVDSLELVKAFTFCNSNALEEIKKGTIDAWDDVFKPTLELDLLKIPGINADMIMQEFHLPSDVVPVEGS